MFIKLENIPSVSNINKPNNIPVQTLESSARNLGCMKEILSTLISSLYKERTKVTQLALPMVAGHVWKECSMVPPTKDCAYLI